MFCIGEGCSYGENPDRDLPALQKWQKDIMESGYEV